VAQQTRKILQVSPFCSFSTYGLATVLFWSTNSSNGRPRLRFVYLRFWSLSTEMQSGVKCWANNFEFFAKKHMNV
jgi:cell shape-determining protein MreD